MKAYHYRWLLIFFILWLPVQGSAAAVLSVCVQEKNFHREIDKSEPIIDSHHHEGCHKQAADDGSAHPVLTGLPCDDISCNAYSNTPILSGYTALLPIKITSAVILLSSGFTSFVPEQPQRPPLPVFL